MSLLHKCQNTPFNKCACATDNNSSGSLNLDSHGTSEDAFGVILIFCETETALERELAGARNLV